MLRQVGEDVEKNYYELEKAGVEPDEIMLPTPADRAARRDPVLARAVAMAGGALSPEDAGRLFK